jgi:hypothetical protein
MNAESAKKYGVVDKSIIKVTDLTIMPRKIQVVPAAQVGEALFEKIQQLRTDYYEHILLGQPHERVRRFLGEMTLVKWQNPNRAVGSSLTSSGQAFARPQPALKTNRDGEALTSVSLYADNASSDRSFPVGAVERAIKLHGPIALVGQKRYRVIRELVADTPDDAARLIDVACDETPQQPKSAYVLSAETDVISVLRAAGFTQMMISIPNRLDTPSFRQLLIHRQSRSSVTTTKLFDSPCEEFYNVS